MLILLFAVYFFAGFTIVFKFVSQYIEEKTTQSVENNPGYDYEVLAFTENDVQIIEFDKIEEFKSLNPRYSFLVPKGKENYFSKQLNQRNNEMKFDIEAVQISEERQLIRLSSDDIRSVVINKYEATDKQVFPKTITHQNMRDTLFKTFPSLIGGLFTSFIFFLIYRKHFVR